MNKDSWKWKTLGSISDIHDYKRKPITKKDRKIGIYPYYGATGIQDYIDNYIFDGSFVLVGEDGAKWGSNENTAFLINGKFWVNNHAHVLQMHNDIFPKWVVYYLNHKDLNEFITGAVVPKLNQAALRSIPIPVPFISIQKQIVKELDTLSDIITKKKEQLAELDKLAQATFYDMFGDPIKNEKNWEIKELKYFGNVLTGNTPSRKKIEYYSEPYIEWIKTDNITESLIISQAKEYLSKEGYKISKSVNKGAILVTCIAGSLKSIGRAALTDREVCFNQQINAIQPSSLVNSIFLYWLIKTTKSYIEEKTPGVLKFILSKSKFENLIFIFPPISAQTQFAEKIEAIEQQKALINQSITDTQLLFDYTMDKYFN
ncbi:restriction endonuclease subunit S [Snodgrassella alvi]|uniref:restriction endonuclease subunit S n=1 Tax=Snodgrassella alvi TaxID=1196083 RepID=UPI00351C9066